MPVLHAIIRVPDGQAPRAEAGVREQLPASSRVDVCEDWTTALRAAGGGADGWVWLLDGGAVPGPGAIDALLAGDDPRAAVLAGVVVDRDGRPVAHALPRATEGATQAVVDGVREGAIPIRTATFAHTLVRPDLLRRHGLPRTDRLGSHAALELTARMLRDASGRLVLASTATWPDDAPPPTTSFGDTVRMVRTGIWSRGEALRAVRASVGR